jgi:hypothetical protein
MFNVRTFYLLRLTFRLLNTVGILSATFKTDIQNVNQYELLYVYLYIVWHVLIFIIHNNTKVVNIGMLVINTYNLKVRYQFLKAIILWIFFHFCTFFLPRTFSWKREDWRKATWNYRMLQENKISLQLSLFKKIYA